MGKFDFFKALSSLFGSKKKAETKSCCQHDVVEPPVVETTEVDKITERLIDVSTKPLTEVKTEEKSVKEIKSKSRKKVVKTEEAKVEEPKSEKPKAKKKATKKSADKKTK